MESIKNKIQELDIKSEELQKQGKYLDSLDVMGEALNARKEIYGEDSEEFIKQCDKLCELCNMIAMIFLDKNKNEGCFEFLKKAEILSQNSSQLKAITYNNMACYYRKIGKLRIALTYLQQALDLEIKIDNPQNIADTHLNLCAILSQLDRHSEALEHILLCIVMLQDDYILFTQSKQNSNNNDKTNQEQTSDSKDHENNNDRLQVLAIAYHNLGVELEHLKRYDEALQTYQKALKFAVNNLGPQSSIVDNLKKVLQAANDQIENMKQKQQKKKQDKEQQRAQTSQGKERLFKKSYGDVPQNQKKNTNTQGQSSQNQKKHTPYNNKSINNGNFLQARPKISEKDDLSENETQDNKPNKLSSNQDDNINLIDEKKT